MEHQHLTLNDPLPVLLFYGSVATHIHIHLLLAHLPKLIH
jgi:hypothetical protein